MYTPFSNENIIRQIVNYKHLLVNTFGQPKADITHIFSMCIHPFCSPCCLSVNALNSMHDNFKFNLT